MFIQKKPPHLNLKQKPVSSRNRFFYFNCKGIKRLTKVGFVSASLLIAINAYAATDSKVITVHIRVVVDSSLEVYEESAGREAIEIKDLGLPDFAGFNAYQGKAMDMNVRATVVEGASYHEILPFTP